MSFYVYAGLAGGRSQDWHRDCGSSGVPMAVDISGAAGSAVSFRIRNNNPTAPLSFRYRIDCATYHTNTKSSVLVLVTDVPAEEEGEEVASFYAFRYTHLNIASNITEVMSAASIVQPGSTGSLQLRTLSDATVKSGRPINVVAPKDTWAALCPDTNSKTDVGGLCSSGAHLHQAGSNGNDPCLRIDQSGQCSDMHPISLSAPSRSNIPNAISANTIIFSA